MSRLMRIGRFEKSEAREVEDGYLENIDLVMYSFHDLTESTENRSRNDYVFIKWIDNDPRRIHLLDGTDLVCEFSTNELRETNVKLGTAGGVDDIIVCLRDFFRYDSEAEDEFYSDLELEKRYL